MPGESVQRPGYLVAQTSAPKATRTRTVQTRHPPYLSTRSFDALTERPTESENECLADRIKALAVQLANSNKELTTKCGVLSTINNDLVRSTEYVADRYDYLLESKTRVVE